MHLFTLLRMSLTGHRKKFDVEREKRVNMVRKVKSNCLSSL